MIVRRSAPVSAPRPFFLDDGRLDLDEIGAMFYFCFLPDGSEVDLIATGKKLNCGTSRFGRILKTLRAFKYVETRANYRRGRGAGRGRTSADFIVREQATR